MYSRLLACFHDAMVDIQPQWVRESNQQNLLAYCYHYRDMKPIFQEDGEERIRFGPKKLSVK